MTLSTIQSSIVRFMTSVDIYLAGRWTSDVVGHVYSVRS